MAQQFLFDSAALHAAPDGTLPKGGVAAARGILLGMAISLPIWAFILWLLF